MLAPSCYKGCKCDEVGIRRQGCCWWSAYDFSGLRIYLNARPEALSAIQDKRLRLLYTGPAELRIVDIAKLIKNKSKDSLIISQINSISAPYKKFSVDELMTLKQFKISDEVVVAMIAITTEYNKEQKHLAEEQRSQISRQKHLQVQQAKQQYIQDQQPLQKNEVAVNAPLECLQLAASIKACDQSNNAFVSILCKAIAESQFKCPISIGTLMR